MSEHVFGHPLSLSSEGEGPDWKCPIAKAGSLQGISSNRGLAAASMAAKKGIKPEPYGPIPYVSEQGIFYGLAGNLNRRSGKFPPSSGNPCSRPLFRALPCRPIRSYRSFREISTVCREPKRDAARCSRHRVVRRPSQASRRARRCTELAAVGGPRVQPCLPPPFPLLPRCLCTCL